MGLTVMLSVWSLSNKGFNRGWRIFQGRSAVFWGLAFGYMYGGSIASLSALSNGNFLDITAGGHVLTALVIIAFAPFTVSMIGVTSEIENSEIMDTGAHQSPNISPAEELVPDVEDENIGGHMEEAVTKSDEDDVVELLD